MTYVRLAPSSYGQLISSGGKGGVYPAGISVVAIRPL